MLFVNKYLYLNIYNQRKKIVKTELPRDKEDPKIVPLTRLFFSSSNTGFLHRGEDGGFSVGSAEISGSIKTIPTAKKTYGANKTV